MKKTKYILLLSILMVWACDNFLDVKPDASLVVPHTLEDAQALLDDMFRMNQQTVPARGECVSDDYYLPEAVYNSRPVGERHFYHWDYQEYFGYNNDWGAAYAPIYHANLALELIGKIARTESNQVDWDNVKGSALFYRAFYFFKLLVVFAPAYDKATADLDHGIALRLNTDFNQLSTRASVSDCYERILHDLYEAMDHLPTFPQHVSRPSKVAVYALLSNIHHYRGEYENSLDFADKVLSLKNDLMDYNGDEHIGNMTTSSSPFVKFNKETIFYAELTNGYVFARSRAVVDTNLIESYAPYDLRKVAFFRMTGGQAYYKGPITGNAARQFGGLSTSEILLNKAESLAKLKRSKDAIETLNVLLEKRLAHASDLLDPSDFDAHDALQMIRSERRKELIFRGIRFTDLKRYNIEGSGIVLRRNIGGKIITLEPNSSKYALPLPQDLIEITRMPQN